MERRIAALPAMNEPRLGARVVITLIARDHCGDYHVYLRKTSWIIHLPDAPLF
jgi:hypothetical protein